MITSEELAARPRAERRARTPRPTVREQRFHGLMRHLLDSKTVTPETEETPREFMRRLKFAAARVQHEQRRRRRQSVRAARKANR